MKQKLHLVLGSQSPRRQQLLHALGFDFVVRVKPTEETFPDDLKRESIALYLAALKAKALEDSLADDELLITSDTIVWVDDQQLGKPADYAEAFRMLKQLAGRTHEVFTAVCLLGKNKHDLFSVRTEVTFNALSDEEIDLYLNQFKPYDKAGSYGAQDFLKEGMNPCSEEETQFLKKIGRPNLFIHTRTAPAAGLHAVDGIASINGSYFNVMGLPIVELYNHLESF